MALPTKLNGAKTGSMLETNWPILTALEAKRRDSRSHLLSKQKAKRRASRVIVSDVRSFAINCGPSNCIPLVDISTCLLACHISDKSPGLPPTFIVVQLLTLCVNINRSVIASWGKEAIRAKRGRRGKLRKRYASWFPRLLEGRDIADAYAMHGSTRRLVLFVSWISRSTSSRTLRNS
jgi:hypothetical protein